MADSLPQGTVSPYQPTMDSIYGYGCPDPYLYTPVQ